MDLTLQTRTIYNNLSDDLSKHIFIKRLLGSLTSDSRFFFELSALNQSKFKNYLNSYKNKFEGICIYGAGYLSLMLTPLIGVSNTIAYCDSDEKKQNTYYYNRKVISPECLAANHSNSLCFIAVQNIKHENEIFNHLMDLGFPQEQILRYSTVLSETVGNHYFNNDLIPNPLMNKEEVFVDAGCLDFATSLEFAKWCDGNYRKIIAFEPDSKQYPICVRNAENLANAEVHPFGLWNENAELRFEITGEGGSRISTESNSNINKIEAVSLDQFLNGEKVTFIKMDIEGAELNALKGAKHTITNNRPKLAICVYHKPEDIYEIPSYILSLHSDYKIYLRHYSFGSYDTVLYAL